MRAARLNLRKRITTMIAHELEDELAELYSVARANARNDLEQHHELEASKRLARRCPYTLDQIRDPDWWPARVAVNA